MGWEEGEGTMQARLRGTHCRRCRGSALSTRKDRCRDTTRMRSRMDAWIREGWSRTLRYFTTSRFPSILLSTLVSQSNTNTPSITHSNNNNNNNNNRCINDTWIH
jgi:hypothetical protein